MGLEVKKNSKGKYKLISTISDESYHPEKKWVSENDAKKILIEVEFLKFIKKTLEIDKCFPTDYYINGVKDFKSNSKSEFLRWLIDNSYSKDSTIVFEKFNELIVNLKIDLKT
jgi:hypothetical protein